MSRAPLMICCTAAGVDAWQMTVWQPAAVAMRAAASLVAMPPVPHCVPFDATSACSQIACWPASRCKCCADRNLTSMRAHNAGVSEIGINVGELPKNIEYR